QVHLNFNNSNPLRETQPANSALTFFSIRPRGDPAGLIRDLFGTYSGLGLDPVLKTTNRPNFNHRNRLTANPATQTGANIFSAVPAMSGNVWNVRYPALAT